MLIRTPKAAIAWLTACAQDSELLFLDEETGETFGCSAIISSPPSKESPKGQTWLVIDTSGESENAFDSLGEKDGPAYILENDDESIHARTAVEVVEDVIKRRGVKAA